MTPADDLMVLEKFGILECEEVLDYEDPFIEDDNGDIIGNVVHFGSKELKVETEPAISASHCIATKWGRNADLANDEVPERKVPPVVLLEGDRKMNNDASKEKELEPGARNWKFKNSSTQKTSTTDLKNTSLCQTMDKETLGMGEEILPLTKPKGGARRNILRERSSVFSKQNCYYANDSVNILCNICK